MQSPSSPVPVLAAVGVVALCLVLAATVPVVAVAGSERTATLSPNTADATADACVDQSVSVESGGSAFTNAGPQQSPDPVGEPRPGVGASASAADETRVPLGGLAFVTLTVTEGFDNTVVVGAGTNHTTRMTVTDDGDGEVTLRVNTYAAANDTAVSPRSYRAVGDDRVEVETAATNATMTEGTYPISVYRDGVPVDETRLNVTGPDFGTVTALAGPPQLFEAGTLHAIRTAEDLGMLSRDRTIDDASHVGFGETVVFRIESPTLLGAVAAQPGESLLERFRRVYDREPVGFAVTGPCVYFEFAQKVERGAVRAVTEYANGTAYLLVDLDRAKWAVDYGQFEIDVDEPNPLGVEGASIDFDGARYYDRGGRPIVDRLGPASYRQRVDGIVTWPSDGFVEITGERDGYPGRIPVTVRSLTDPTDVVRTATDPPGDSFRALVDLPRDSDPGLFEVAVGNTTYTAKVGDPPNATWELAVPEGRERVDRLGIEQLTLEDGGFLVAYRPVENGSAFRRVGSAHDRSIAMPITPVNRSTHLVTVAYRDGNGNGRFDGPETDPAYRVGGDAVREWVPVPVANETATEGPPLGSFAVSKVGEPVAGLPEQATAAGGVTETPTATVADEPDGTTTGSSTSRGTEPRETPEAESTAQATATGAQTEAPTVAPTSTQFPNHTTVTSQPTRSTAAGGPGLGIPLACATVLCFVVGLAALHGRDS